MAVPSKKSAAPAHGSKVLKAVKDHPVAAAGIVAGAVAGAVLARKVVNTAAKVVTIKAAADGASKVVRAARGSQKK